MKLSEVCRLQIQTGEPDSFVLDQTELNDGDFGIAGLEDFRLNVNAVLDEDQLDGSINKNSASYAALTGQINNASGALNQYRLFATQGANNLLNTKAFESGLGNLNLGGGNKGGGSSSSPEIIGGVNLQEIVDKLIKVQDKITDITFLELTGGASKKTIDAQLKTALQEFDILTKQAERFGQTITQGDNRTNAEDARNYSITINTLQPSAEVGKAVVQAIGAFAERGGNTGSFLDKFR